jgi:hypothetical protein
MLIPGTESSVQIPPEVAERIDHSVFQFESKFAGFGMLAIARNSGWTEEFRKELTEIALLCLLRPSGGPR